MSLSVSVLVVDDQAPFRLAARTVIDRTAGFEVVGEAASGEEAVEMARSLEPDLVLMDVKLPGIDGVTATSRIIADRPGSVVFLCSTYERDDLPGGADLGGAVAYVHKAEFSAALLRQLWEHRPLPGSLGP